MGLRSGLVLVGLGIFGLGLSQDISVWDFKQGNYSLSVPRPFDPVGFRVGTRHITSSEVVEYMKAVDLASDRVSVGDYGRSFDNREMPFAVVSSPENLRNIRKIVEENRKSVFEADRVTDADLEKKPIIVWVGCGVHGNEASGVEAGLMTLFHLAADRSGETEKMLQQMVVIIAPNYNPDGRDRFANWVNSQRGALALPDGQDREHSEPWPGGRTNKYWFDLNRDWFPLTQVESSSRHELVMRFRPQLVLDYHEQGGENYFFQPGVQSRVNRFTPKRNQELTFDFARYYAKELEKVSEAYFTEQRYDDFYIGKGSTYPDVTGAVGILFEQASSRSLRRETPIGELTFGNSIRNQVVTALASLEAARDMRKTLLKYQRDFFRDVPSTGSAFEVEKDESGAKLVNLLLQHEIRVEDRGKWIVPVDQPLGRLVQAMFEVQKEFDDTVFYDISAWSLQYVTEAKVKKITLPDTQMAMKVTVVDKPVSFSVGGYMKAENPVGFILRKGTTGFHGAVFDAMESGRVAYFATRAIGSAAPGDVFIAGGSEDESYFAALARDRKVKVEAVPGQTGEIVSWGGNAVTRLPKARIALLVGEGVDSNNAGEVWWMLDRELGIPVALLDASRVSTLDLARYSAILVTGGRYPADAGEALATYARGGGTVVATASGAVWANGTPLGGLKSASVSADYSGMSFGQIQEARQVDLAPGAILAVDYDLTHPLMFGVDSPAAFREGASFWEVPVESGVVVGRYRSEAVLSGFVGPGVAELAGGKVAILAKRLGSGRVVLFADNPNFRGFMTAQRRIWLNSIFFGRAF